MLQRIKSLIKKYATLIKRGLLITTIFLMLMAIQILVNYNTIIENTELIKKQTAEVEEEINYINHYQIKFLNSDHAKFFLAHENNILGTEETVIAFKEPKIEEENPEEKEDKLSPREERKAFFEEKLE